MKKSTKQLLKDIFIGMTGLEWVLLALAKYKCPRCNYPLRNRVQHCPNCGQPIRWRNIK